MIGFVILSHRDPAQLVRLVERLNRLYDRPPIACHHDFSQAPLDPADFPDNVRFVAPSLRTSWGAWPVVQGALLALARLYEDGGPDWFMLLSAADYPILPAPQVLAELGDSSVDALLDYRDVDDTPEQAQRRGPVNPVVAHFDRPDIQRIKWIRYVGAQLWLPILRREGGRWRIGRYTIHLPFAAPLSPFDRQFRCFHGDHWFAASRRAAQVLLQPTPRHRKLQRYLKRRASADECYYQSVLCNEPGLRLQRDNKRYAEWNGGGAHPAELGVEALDRTLASGCHFARKFEPDDPVLDRIDKALDLGAPARAPGAIAG